MNESKAAVPTTKKPRNRRDRIELAASHVAEMSQDELRRFRDLLAKANPTNAALIRGEKVELVL